MILTSRATLSQASAWAGETRVALHAPPPAPTRHGARRTTPPARAVRIIGGQWKRTPLAVAAVEGLRPTPDRVRESVFNWLTHFLGGALGAGSALDLFAGSGALGFEAASRGAVQVVLVETEPSALRALAAAKAKLNASQIEIVRGDALACVNRFAAEGRQFQIIFLDPPFRSGWIERIARPAAALLRPDGLLYIECEAGLTVEQCQGWGLQLLRADKAGQVFYHLLRTQRGDIPGENTAC